MRKMMFIGFVALTCLGFSQTVPKTLNIDSSYAFIQGFDAKSLSKLASLFENVSKEKVVILHYGGSHIQAENPTTIARNKFHETFGYGGRGLVFSYGAANTYSSVNYGSTCSGKWDFNKSFQGRKSALPLGICGMVVETKDSLASLSFTMKTPIQASNHKCFLFFENDSISHGLQIFINGVECNQDLAFFKHGVSFNWEDSIHSIKIQALKKEQSKRFRFYGLDIENQEGGGVVYHSTGVGAAAFRSILILDKLPEQIQEIKPDIVLLDFGTNDILSTNSISKSLSKEVEQSIAMWRKLNPDILIVLTSTQDLFYKNHAITAGINFRNLMDSLARKNGCLFWNWYDLSGGINTIKNWHLEGYAQKDYIHLTKKGYHVKGSLLFDSFVNTLHVIQTSPGKENVVVPLKSYELYPKDSPVSVPVKPTVVKKAIKKYTVKSGDTLSEIARNHHTTVAKLKSLNALKSDAIRTGQILKLP